MLEFGMLSFHPAASSPLRFALCAVLSGCAAADPVVVGEHETDPSHVSADGLLDGDDSSAEALDPNLNDGFTVGSASCGTTPFRACGGSVAGSWKVVETCNSESRNEESLAVWSEWVGLPAEPCTGAARRLRTNWTGELTFSGKVAYDQRDLSVTFDMGLTSRCLTAALESAGTVMPTAGACAALTSGFDVTCGSRDGMCECSAEAMVSTESTVGNYDIRGSRLSNVTANNAVREYDYCVQGDYLLYKDVGESRYAILKRVPLGASEAPR
jgi:hypothetical protein